MLESEVGKSEPEEATSEASVLAEYAEVGEHVRWLADVRFKLLAILPASTGFAVFQVMDSTHAVIKLWTGIFGAWVTLCLYVYHLRNDQLYNDLVGRLGEIERELKLRRGAFARRVPTWSRFLGLTVEHGWPIRGIYFASFTAWILLAASEIGDAAILGGAVAGGALLGGAKLYGHANNIANKKRIDGVARQLRRFLSDGADLESLADDLVSLAPHLVEKALTDAGISTYCASSADKRRALALRLQAWREDTGAKYATDPDTKIKELLGFSRYTLPKDAPPPTLRSAPASPAPSPKEGE